MSQGEGWLSWSLMIGWFIFLSNLEKMYLLISSLLETIPQIDIHLFIQFLMGRMLAGKGLKMSFCYIISRDEPNYARHSAGPAIKLWRDNEDTRREETFYDPRNLWPRYKLTQSHFFHRMMRFRKVLIFSHSILCIEPSLDWHYDTWTWPQLVPGLAGK